MIRFVWQKLRNKVLAFLVETVILHLSGLSDLLVWFRLSYERSLTLRCFGCFGCSNWASFRPTEKDVVSATSFFLL